MPDIFTAIRQQTTEWLKDSGYHRSELAKELGWSESFLSEFMSGKTGLGGLTLCQLTSVVSKPAKVNKPNKGARICSAQSMGRTIKGVLELNEENIAAAESEHTAALFEKQRKNILNLNKGTVYEVNRNEEQF